MNGEEPTSSLAATITLFATVALVVLILFNV